MYRRSIIREGWPVKLCFPQRLLLIEVAILYVSNVVQSWLTYAQLTVFIIEIFKMIIMCHIFSECGLSGVWNWRIFILILVHIRLYKGIRLHQVFLLFFAFSEKRAYILVLFIITHLSLTVPDFVLADHLDDGRVWRSLIRSISGERDTRWLQVCRLIFLMLFTIENLLYITYHIFVITPRATRFWLFLAHISRADFLFFVFLGIVAFGGALSKQIRNLHFFIELVAHFLRASWGTQLVNRFCAMRILATLLGFLCKHAHKMALGFSFYLGLNHISDTHRVIWHTIT